MSEWVVKQGNTAIQDVLIKDKDGNAVTNLDTATELKFQVKKKRTDSVALIEKTKADGISVLTGDDLGKLRITLDPEDTEIAVEKYFCGLQIKFDANTIYEVNLTVDGRETDIFRIVQDVVE